MGTCVRRDKRYAAARDRGKPPYKAEGCAWQTRVGEDGRQYRSQPNDQGQFVWVAVPKTRLQRARSAARGAWREYGPTAAGLAARRAAIILHRQMLPGVNFYNQEMAWEQANPRAQSLW